MTTTILHYLATIFYRKKNLALLGLIFILSSALCQAQNNTLPNKGSFFLSNGMIKWIHTQTPKLKDNYLGSISIQTGYIRRISDDKKLILNTGLVIKAILGEYPENCESTSIVSLPLKLRFENDLFSNKFTYGLGMGITYYYFNFSRYDEFGNNIRNDAVNINYLGPGLDATVYYNCRNWKFGININPSAYNLRDNKFNYTHTIFLEVRYNFRARF